MREIEGNTDWLSLYDRIDKSCDLMSKASSMQSGMSRDCIDYDHWDKNKLDAALGQHGKCVSEENEKADQAKKEQHPLVKYIKFQVPKLSLSLSLF